MQDLLPSVIGDENTVEGSVSQSDTRISESIHSSDVLSVTQLLESVYFCPSELMSCEAFFYKNECTF
jgi:hypothetical protein